MYDTSKKGSVLYDHTVLCVSLLCLSKVRLNNWYPDRWKVMTSEVTFTLCTASSIVTLSSVLMMVNLVVNLAGS